MLKRHAPARWFLVLATSLSLAGCGYQASFASYDGNTVTNHDHPFRVEVGPLVSEWLLENTRPERKNDQVVAKIGPDYERVVKFDLEGDGVYDLKQKIRRYELLFRNRETDARLSLSVFPIDQQLEQTDLTVLARDYVDAASGAGAVEVDWGEERKGSVEKRFASRILDIEPVSVGGYEAVGVTFEVANVDQLQLSDESRWIRARMLLIRAPWRWNAQRSTSYVVKHEKTWPVMMRVLFTARPEAFDRSSEAFTKLVEGIEFMGDEAVLAGKLDSIRRCFEMEGQGIERAAVEWIVGDRGQLHRFSSADLPLRVARRCNWADDLRFVGTGRTRDVIFSIPRTGPIAPPSSAPKFGERWPTSGEGEPPAAASNETAGGESPVATAEAEPTGEAPATPAASPESIESRLEKLKSLHERGLISDEEYQSKRAAILDSI